MVVGVVGIVLGGVVLAHQRIGGQVQEQAKVARREEVSQNAGKPIVLRQLADQQERAYAEAAAAERAGLLPGEVLAGKVLAVVLVWDQHAVRVQLADGGSSGNVEAALLVVHAVVLIVDVGHAPDTLAGEPAVSRQRDADIQIHAKPHC